MFYPSVDTVMQFLTECQTYTFLTANKTTDNFYQALISLSHIVIGLVSVFRTLGKMNKTCVKPTGLQNSLKNRYNDT